MEEQINKYKHFLPSKWDLGKTTTVEQLITKIKNKTNPNKECFEITEYIKSMVIKKLESGQYTVEEYYKYYNSIPKNMSQTALNYLTEDLKVIYALDSKTINEELSKLKDVSYIACELSENPNENDVIKVGKQIYHHYLKTTKIFAICSEINDYFIQDYATYEDLMNDENVNKILIEIFRKSNQAVIESPLFANTAIKMEENFLKLSKKRLVEEFKRKSSLEEKEKMRLLSRDCKIKRIRKSI